MWLFLRLSDQYLNQLVTIRKKEHQVQLPGHQKENIMQGILKPHLLEWFYCQTFLYVYNNFYDTK